MKITSELIGALLLVIVAACFVFVMAGLANNQNESIQDVCLYCSKVYPASDDVYGVRYIIPSNDWVNNFCIEKGYSNGWVSSVCDGGVTCKKEKGEYVKYDCVGLNE